LEEVVVTATKRAESLQDVPVSVSAIGSDELGQLKMRDTTEIAAQVPNMQIATPLGDSMPVISIRGISMDDFSLNQSSPVAIYVDEVYKGRPFDPAIPTPR
jgi:iron complex outermembrane receptor protein